MFMAALVTIAGYELPEPSAYSASTSTLVDSARNVNGYVIWSVVRNDVAKVELSWRYLTAEQWANILSLFSRSFYNSVTFFNQATAKYETRQMYVGDRSAGMWRRHPVTGEVMGFTECKFSLIEV
jgi:hypothetical protein